MLPLPQGTLWWWETSGDGRKDSWEVEEGCGPDRGSTQWGLIAWAWPSCFPAGADWDKHSPLPQMLMVRAQVEKWCDPTVFIQTQVLGPDTGPRKDRDPIDSVLQIKSSCLSEQDSGLFIPLISIGINCPSTKKGFPGGSVVKNPPAMQETWVRKIPWRRKWLPTPVFLPGKSDGQRSLESYSPRGHKSQTWMSD